MAQHRPEIEKEAAVERLVHLIRIPALPPSRIPETKPSVQAVRSL